MLAFHLRASALTFRVLPPTPAPLLSIIEGRPLEELAAKATQAGSAAYYFLLVLAVCHTVVIETLEDGSQDYQVSEWSKRRVYTIQGAHVADATHHCIQCMRGRNAEHHVVWHVESTLTLTDGRTG